MMEVHKLGRSIVWSGAREQAEVYAQKLQAHDCRLMLAEVEQTARETLAKQDDDGLFGDDNVFAVDEQFDRSVLEAQAEAQRWIAARR